jgi:hypothetical protein
LSVHNVSPSSNQDGLHRIQVIQRNQEVFGRTLRDHSVATTAKRLTLAGKIDAVLKLSVVVSVLLASSSVGYYYLVHLAHPCPRGK